MKSITHITYPRICALKWGLSFAIVFPVLCLFFGYFLLVVCSAIGVASAIGFPVAAIFFHKSFLKVIYKTKKVEDSRPNPFPKTIITDGQYKTPIQIN